MLRSPTSGQFDLPSLTVDEDEADLTVLEDSLRSTDQYCKDIARQLDFLAASNAKSIRNMGPLMGSINQLKVQQDNINSAMSLVEDVRGQTSGIKQLDETKAQNEGLRNLSQIEQYTKNLSRYNGVRSQLVSQNLDGFSGVMKGLDKSIRDSDVTLKYEMIAKLKKLGELQKASGGDNTMELELMKQIKYIYAYMKSERNMDLMENIVRERSTHLGSVLKQFYPLQLPALVKDQNYLYSGSKDGNTSFVRYAQGVCIAFDKETQTMAQLFTSPQETAAALRQVSVPLFNEVTKQSNSFVAFSANNKYAYGPILYEVSEGLHLLLNMMSQKHIEPPPQLLTDSKKAGVVASQIFQDFFEFINMRYKELSVPDHPNETLNNTFMMLVTRLNKLSMFRDQQLQFISGMPNGSWLPQFKPKGFQPNTIQSADPQYLLSNFYADSIEYSFYNLCEKFKPHMTEEDLGVMLLFNLDGLQNLVDSRSQLKSILGQQGATRIDHLKKKAIDYATTDWSEMTTKLMEASTKQGESFNMRNKDMGKFIDEFTKKFNDNCRKLQQKNLPPFFKKELAQNIRKMLGPAYRVFYMSVANDSSAKSVMKHFKYDVNSFEQKLLTLA